VDQSNRVWIATDSGANYYFSGDWGAINRVNLRYETSNSSGTVTRYKVSVIEPGRSGATWFGQEGGGVRRWREGASRAIWTTYRAPADLVSNVIRSISVERVSIGKVWIATTNGISLYTPDQVDPELGAWTDHTYPEIGSNQVYASAINETDRSVWFGTSLGLERFDNLIAEWQSIPLTPPYNYPVNSLSFDGLGTLWIGKVVGVTSYNPVLTAWNHYTNENTGGKLPPGEIHAVTTDGSSTRWFGTDHGLVRLSDTTWTTFTTADVPELPGNVITSVKYDRKGNLWIGTTQGIAVFNETGIVY